MDVCKILDLTPGIEMTSWGTIHLPEEKRIMEFVINVLNGRWRSLRYGSCMRAPQGGFSDIKKGHEEHLAAFDDLDPGKLKVQMICKEGVTVDEVIRLVHGELGRSGFPHSLEKEADALRDRIERCRMPVERKTKARFKVE